MRIVSVSPDQRLPPRNSATEEVSRRPCSDRQHLVSRSPDLNVLDNLTDKKCEKHLTVIVNPVTCHRNMTAPPRCSRGIERSDRSSASANGANSATTDSWQSCEDNKSIADVTTNNKHIAQEEDDDEEEDRRTKRSRDRLVKGLCMAGWLLCFPCCIFGFVLREPPETDADLSTDPCWPFAC